MTTLAVLTPEGFTAQWEATLKKDIKVWPARSWSPTLLSNPCDRHVVWRMTRADEQMPHEVSLQAIFNEGRVHQPSVYTTLEAMGFELVKESDRPTQWRPAPGITISGYIDGRIIGYRGQRIKPSVVLEIKALAHHSWERLNTIDDFLTHEAHYIRGYLQQMDLYLLLENLPLGVFVLKSKASARLKLIPVELDLDRAEQTVQRIERLAPMVAARQDPPPIRYDAKLCGDCGFRYICWPPREEAGLEILQAPELVEALADKERLDAAHRAWEAADRRIKAAMEGRLAETGDQLLVDGGDGGRYLASLKVVTTKERLIAAGIQRRLTFERVDRPSGGSPDED